MSIRQLIGIISASVLAVYAIDGQACSSVLVRAGDNTVVVGRTMDFPFLLGFSVAAFPAGQSFKSMLANNQTGMSWTTKYAYFGVLGTINSQKLGKLEGIADGQNEKGLSAEEQWLPETNYGTVTNPARAMAVQDFLGWVLGNFATVDEVLQALKQNPVHLYSPQIPEIQGQLPLHFAIEDLSGKRIVLEFMRGKMKIYHDPIGVMTNSPGFNWQVTNLRYYLALSAKTPDSLTLNTVRLDPVGNGGGMLGLPGNYSSPARFVRLVALHATATKPHSGHDAEILTTHLMNSVDVPMGAVQIVNPQKTESDRTLWTVIKNTTQNRWQLRAYNDANYMFIDVAKVWDAMKKSTKPLVVPLAQLDQNAQERNVTEKFLNSK